MVARRDRLVGLAAVLTLAGLIGLVSWYLGRPERKASRLVDELRRTPPGYVERWLTSMGLLRGREDRPKEEIIADLESLGAVGVPGLIEATRDHSVFVRAAAAGALGRLGDAAHGAGPALVRLLMPEERKDWSEDLPFDMIAAAHAIVAVGVPAERAVPALAGALETGLGSFGVKPLAAFGEKSVPAMVRIVEDEKREEWARLSAVAVLGNIGPPARTAVPCLLTMLAQRPRFRPAVAWALGRVGPNARVALPLLAELARSEDRAVAYAATAALARIDPKDHLPRAIEVFRDALRDPRRDVRVDAITGLAMVGPDAASEIPALEILAVCADEYVAEAAAEAISGIGASEDDPILAIPMMCWPPLESHDVDEPRHSQDKPKSDSAHYGVPASSSPAGGRRAGDGT